MNKKLMSLTLSSAIILNATSQITSVYAGEGTQNAGNGSKENPYQNVRTALENIKDGGTLKLVGSVT